VRERLLAAGIAPLLGLEAGMTALGLAMDVGAWFADGAEAPLPVTVSDGAGTDAGLLAEWQA
ncbi:MAG: hypothetical protein GWO02_10440, partial [Gammaproteobacteria bacterium]|nr:hypothetical protein [Gammaproteobacteria bacterium]